MTRKKAAALLLTLVIGTFSSLYLALTGHTLVSIAIFIVTFLYFCFG